MIRRSLFVLLSTFVSAAFAQNLKLTSPSLAIDINSKTGGIQSIINRQDKYQMNWILKSDSTQYPWQTSKLAWGLGFTVVNGDTVRWNKPVSMVSKNNQSTIRYRSKYFDLVVERQLNADGQFTESYQFINTTSKSITLTGSGIFTPFNDNYPDSKTCVEQRCNSHIWTGENASYVFAERMGGEAPHLGLVLTKGAIERYEILNRNRNVYAWALSGSNVRGTIVLNPAAFTLKPKQSHTLKWVLFPADNWAAFYAKAKSLGFVKASADSYTLEKNQPLHATFESNRTLENVQCFLNGKTVPFKQNGGVVEVDVKPETEGEQLLRMNYNGNQSTFVKAYRIADIESLLKKRALFIVNHQQLNDTTDARNGAYMVYDNETRSIYKNDDSRKSSDTNEGRERVGMGVFLAMYLQQHPDAMIQNSLERYCRFVRNRLQRPDYSVLNSVSGKEKMRVYNYPWVAHLYLEMYKLTQDKMYLTDFYKTLHKYFVDSKYHFYAIGVPAQDGLIELKNAGMIAQHDTILADCRTTADNFLETGLYYPKSEVNFEQSIVAPSVVFLFEMYQITHEEKYLKEGEKQLTALEMFSGFQPDYHLNEIGIRHWDGYWFGKRQFWGDVMPHYWSAITSEAYVRFARISGKSEYQKRAEAVVKNNLCQFFNDGSASCAYLYPSKVNGQKAAFFDPFANDQDWALVFYLKYLRLAK